MIIFVFGVLLVHATFINALMETASTTVQIQNYEGPIYIHGDTKTLTCDNHLPSSGNFSPYDNHHNIPTYEKYPTVTSILDKPNVASFAPNDSRYPTLTVTPQIIHSSIPNHQPCGTDCKCVTKHQTSCVPVNNVPQYTPYYSQYPEGYYGYVYPETDISCPKISETLIPLLKTYLSLNGSKTKSCQQCGHNHSSY